MGAELYRRDLASLGQQPGSAFSLGRERDELAAARDLLTLEFSDLGLEHLRPQRAHLKVISRTEITMAAWTQKKRRRQNSRCLLPQPTATRAMLQSRRSPTLLKVKSLKQHRPV